jgi:hypothetical protein
MIAYFGGFDKITPEAWAGFDDALEDWKALLRGRMLCRAQTEW